MNKIVSTKRTSVVFLAIVLVAGVIALSSPSFMTASAQAIPDYEMDDNYGKPYEKDFKKDSVSIKKINCINPSVNINGDNKGDIYIGETGQVVPYAAAPKAKEYGSDGERYNNGYDDEYNKKDKDFV